MRKDGMRRESICQNVIVIRRIDSHRKVIFSVIFVCLRGEGRNSLSDDVMGCVAGPLSQQNQARKSRPWPLGHNASCKRDAVGLLAALMFQNTQGHSSFLFTRSN